MSVENTEANQMPDEFGGPITDSDDANPVIFQPVDFRAKIKFGRFAASGRFGGPASLAPLALVLAAILFSGIIWVAVGWVAGVSIAGASVATYVFTMIINRR